MQTFGNGAEVARHNRQARGKCHVQCVGVGFRIGAGKPDSVGTFKRQQLGQVSVSVLTAHLNCQVLRSRNRDFGKAQQTKSKPQFVLARPFGAGKQKIESLHAGEFADEKYLFAWAHRSDPLQPRRMRPDNGFDIRKMTMNPIRNKLRWGGDASRSPQQLLHFKAPAIDGPTPGVGSGAGALGASTQLGLAAIFAASRG